MSRGKATTAGISPDVARMVDEHKRLSIQAVMLDVKMGVIEKSLESVRSNIKKRRKEIKRLLKKKGMSFEEVPVRESMLRITGGKESIPDDVMDRYTVFKIGSKKFLWR